MLKQLRKYKKNIYHIFDSTERAFKKVYSTIETVEGFLKSPMQERWLFTSAKKATHDAVIVEIGSFKGRSTVSFGFGCIGTKKHIYAIDLFEGDGGDYGNVEFENIFKSNVDRCGLTEYITPIKKNSLEVAKHWNKPIDILFIDGSHEYHDVKADFEVFYPHVKKGGIIAFHDIKGKWDGVIKFWGEVQASGKLNNIGAVSSLGFGTKL